MKLRMKNPEGTLRDDCSTDPCETGFSFTSLTSFTSFTSEACP